MKYDPTITKINVIELYSDLTSIAMQTMSQIDHTQGTYDEGTYAFESITNFIEIGLKFDFDTPQKRQALLKIFQPLASLILTKLNYYEQYSISWQCIS